MRRPLENVDDYRFRMAMFEAQQNSDMKISDSKHLPARIDSDLDHELMQTQKATDIILLEDKQRNIINRSRLQQPFWDLISMITEGIKDKLKEEGKETTIVDFFESMGTSRAIKGVETLMVTLNKALDLLMKEENFVMESHNLLGSLSDEELDRFSEKLEAGYKVEEFVVEEPTVVEYDDAEWETDDG